MKATVLIAREIVLLGGRYVARIKVYRVGRSRKFPDGIKAKFVLLDAEGGFARLLLDNHEPYGFHMHTRLPQDEEFRMPLSVVDHDEALRVFLDEVERIIRNEEED